MLQEFEIEADAEPKLHELSARVSGGATAEEPRRLAAGLAAKIFSNALGVFLMRVEKFHMVLLEVRQLLRR
jgi:hypothetical protein